MINAFTEKPSLRVASRLPAITRTTNVSLAEFACLFACGGLAALAVGLLHPAIRIPGHAMLRGALPMAMGMALVPRRSAGIVMAIGAGITSLAMSVAHIGVFPATSMLSVLALGPVLDLALLGQSVGWKLYLRFAAGGAVANLLAFGLRMAGLQLGIETGGHGGGGGNGMGGGGSQLMAFGWMALVSFLICGALAGLVSGAVWFRARVHNDLRRN